MNALIPSRSAGLSIIGVLIVAALIFLGGFVYGRHYDAPVVAVQAAHPQVLLGKNGSGGTEAANTGTGKPLDVKTATPPSEKPKATIDIATKAHGPVYVAEARVTPQGNPGLAGSPLAVTPEGNPDDTATSAPQIVANPPAPPADCAGYISHLECPAVHIHITIAQAADGHLDIVALADNGDVVDTATFNPGSLGAMVKRHPLALGGAFPIGLPGAGKYGVAVTYDFEHVPVTAGLDAFTVNGRLASVATVVWHF